MGTFMLLQLWRRLTKISKLTSPPGDMDHSKHCLYSRNCKRNILTNPEIY
jgi:hypothetical protein